ncbi:N-acetylmannosamine-6-phosphate 2-epimerase [Virgibacillus siamensis]|uniref:N-acetylmannosamine-6-phosphate 2-epimerase n=1 Tax=Virgibacillus siamensis TaxID=480071 RepID=UPI001FE2A3FF|nr:N-acetylmannosamine-6-phosphate 2-epimerase [Virgibacillus siamensis]
MYFQLQHGLIVSCQALEDEPLHSSYIMSKMALAAKAGGAVGVRANGGPDIKKIKEEIDLPVIGLVKRNYKNSQVYITPTLKEVKEIVAAGADIIAMDATDRIRPGDHTLEELYAEIRKRFPKLTLMADISTYDEGYSAYQLGFDIVATTLSGNTLETNHHPKPNLQLVDEMVNRFDIPVIAEGGIWEPADLQTAFNDGAFACIIGSAITRPQEITKRFVNHIK